MMTRKDYIATASILASVRDEMYLDVHGKLCEAFANVMAADNPRFDRERFYSAANGKKPL